MTSFVIADTACCCCCCFGLTNHREAASLWLVRQDRATINSGSPPSCSANFCSDRWLHRPRWVGWPVRYLDIYLFYVYGSHSVSCHLAEVTCLPLPQPKLVLDLAMQGWVDLVTAVKVQSPYPRLHITVAFAINSGLRWDSNLGPLTPQSRVLTTRPLWHCNALCGCGWVNWFVCDAVIWTTSAARTVSLRPVAMCVSLSRSPPA